MSALLLVLLAASPAPKLALPGLDRVGVDADKAEFFVEYLAQELFDAGYEVVTRKQIDAVLGLERQKALLGCADTGSSCLAELAGALGAEVILVGSVARLDDEYVFTLKIVSAKDARTLAQRRGGGKSDKAALEWLTSAGRELAETAVGATAPGVAPTASAWSSLPRWVAAVPLVVGVGLGVASGVLYGSSQSSAKYLMSGMASSQLEATMVATSGAQQQVASAVLLGGAVLMLGIAVVLFLLGSST